MAALRPAVGPAASPPAPAARKCSFPLVARAGAPAPAVAPQPPVSWRAARVAARAAALAAASVPALRLRPARRERGAPLRPRLAEQAGSARTPEDFAARGQAHRPAPLPRAEWAAVQRSAGAAPPGSPAAERFGSPSPGQAVRAHSGWRQARTELHWEAPQASEPACPVLRRSPAEARLRGLAPAAETWGHRFARA